MTRAKWLVDFASQLATKLHTPHSTQAIFTWWSVTDATFIVRIVASCKWMNIMLDRTKRLRFSAIHSIFIHFTIAPCGALCILLFLIVIDYNESVLCLFSNMFPWATRMVQHWIRVRNIICGLVKSSVLVWFLSVCVLYGVGGGDSGITDICTTDNGTARSPSDRNNIYDFCTIRPTRTLWAGDDERIELLESFTFMVILDSVSRWLDSHFSCSIHISLSLSFAILMFFRIVDAVNTIEI